MFIKQKYYDIYYINIYFDTGSFTSDDLSTSITFIFIYLLNLIKISFKTWKSVKMYKMVLVISMIIERNRSYDLNIWIY